MGRFLGIPSDYRIVQTDERLMSVGRRYLRRRADALVQRHSPHIPSYHLRVERIGLLRYEVWAYQNRLVKER